MLDYLDCLSYIEYKHQSGYVSTYWNFSQRKLSDSYVEVALLPSVSRKIHSKILSVSS